LATSQAATPSGSPDGWLQFCGDRYLTGRSAAKGCITKPEIHWKHSISGRETYLQVDLPRAGSSKTSLPHADIDAGTVESLLSVWGLAGDMLDIDGTGKLTPTREYGTSRVGKFLPNVPGLQRFVVETKHGADRQQVSNYSMQTRLNGNWEQSWSEPLDDINLVSNPIYGDFDRDGKIEIAFTPWYYVYVVDPETGKLKHKGRFMMPDEIKDAGGRAYGWFGAVDCDGGGRDEFVVICDFVKHMETLAWKDGELQRLWFREFRGPGPELSAKCDIKMRVNPMPVQDIDGDGRKEIVISIIDFSKDNVWHVMAVDSMTGETKLDLPGKHLSGLWDVDGDGVAELMLTSTPGTGLVVPDVSDIEIVSYKGGKLTKLWSRPNEAFETADLMTLPGSISSSGSDGLRTVLCTGPAANQPMTFFSRAYTDTARTQVTLTAWQSDRSGCCRPLTSISGPRLRALACRSLSGSASVLVSARYFDDHGAAVATDGSKASLILSRTLNPAPSQPVVARLNRSSTPTVIVETVNDSVEAFQPQKDGTTRPQWRAHGIGAGRHGVPLDGVVLADLDSDGNNEVLLNGRGSSGCAQIRALRADGSELWHADFDDFPAGHPLWNDPGVWFWQAGHFTDTTKMDVLVVVRKWSAEGWLLDGLTGKLIWSQDSSDSNRALGFAYYWTQPCRNPVTGHDDIRTWNGGPRLYDGRTGKQVESLNISELMPGERTQYYLSTQVHDFLGTGKPQLLIANHEGLALLDADRKPVWVGPKGEFTDWELPPVLGDVDGAGKLEIVAAVASYDVPLTPVSWRLICRSGATGDLRWSLAIPGRPTAPAMADVNGDGRDECVFTVGKTVYAIATSEDGKSAKTAWTLDLPDRLSRVAIADADGSGMAQVVVMSADGYVYGIGEKTR